MIIHLHNPFVAPHKAETEEINESHAPLSYDQRVKDDRKATILLMITVFLSSLLYIFLN